MTKPQMQIPQFENASALKKKIPCNQLQAKKS